MKIIRRESTEFQTSEWSGGSSTELFIHPGDSKLIQRDFEVRLSTAEIRQSESTFTKLPGIKRHLMILEGEILLMHENQPSKKMYPNDTTFFLGDWHTSSSGLCKDFNVMTSGSVESAILPLQIIQDSCVPIPLSDSWKSMLIYCISGKASLQSNMDTYSMQENCLLIATAFNNEDLQICAQSNSQMVITFLTNEL